MTALVVSIVAPCRMQAEYVVFKNGSRLQISFHLMESNGKVKLILMSEGYALVDMNRIEKFEQEDYVPPPQEQERVPALPPLPLPSFSAPYSKMIREASKKTGLHEMLIATVIEAESNFDRYAVSSKGARGLMQLMPDTAAHMGAQSIYDARENILAGARYLRDLLKEFNNNLYLALAAYNAGPEKVISYNGIPPYRETQDYVAKVASRFARRRDTIHFK
ncbi:MAG: lytic transglycosylase domain-containing protein [Acidobacteriia bacterium]|nr:lytic transglycosylase domain-containing protein [Terriglobia bacterium]